MTEEATNRPQSDVVPTHIDGYNPMERPVGLDWEPLGGGLAQGGLLGGGGFWKNVEAIHRQGKSIYSAFTDFLGETRWREKHRKTA